MSTRDPDVDALAPDAVGGVGAHDDAVARVVQLEGARGRPRARAPRGRRRRRRGPSRAGRGGRARRAPPVHPAAARKPLEGSRGASTRARATSGSTPSRSAACTPRWRPVAGPTRVRATKAPPSFAAVDRQMRAKSARSPTQRPDALARARRAGMVASDRRRRPPDASSSTASRVPARPTALRHPASATHAPPSGTTIPRPAGTTSTSLACVASAGRLDARRRLVHPRVVRVGRRVPAGERQREGRPRLRCAVEPGAEAVVRHVAHASQRERRARPARGARRAGCPLLRARRSSCPCPRR